MCDQSITARSMLNPLFAICICYTALARVLVTSSSTTAAVATTVVTIATAGSFALMQTRVVVPLPPNACLPLVVDGA